MRIFLHVVFSPRFSSFLLFLPVELKSFSLAEALVLMVHGVFRGVSSARNSEPSTDFMCVAICTHMIPLRSAQVQFSSGSNGTAVASHGKLSAK